MKAGLAGWFPRVSAGWLGAVILFLVYVTTLAPDVTFWDAGEFIAAAHSLGIPHPPGTPLYVLLLNVWAKLLPLSFAAATNLFSAFATAIAAGVSGRMVHRWTQNSAMALSAALAAGGMSSVWLNATETEVYAVSLLLGVLMIWSSDHAGRASDASSRRWTYLTAYLMALAVPLHLSALVAAPAAIALASYRADRIDIRRAVMLAGVFVIAMGAGRVSAWMIGVGVVLVVGGRWWVVGDRGHASSPTTYHQSPITLIAITILALTALAFLYIRAQFDPAIDQGHPATWQGLTDMIARRQYDVSPMWPRKAPVWVQFGNLFQYADWQAALSLGPTVLPSPLRTLFTVLFAVLGYKGAFTHWQMDRRSCIGVALLFFAGLLGVLIYLNLHAGPSIGYGILPATTVREARERDYFFVFGFWAWGLWAGIGAVSLVSSLRRPAWTAALVASLPIVLNWRAVTRRDEPEQSLPRVLAEALLESAPANSVLFVMGDNDSYPLWYAQEIRGIRRDVAVVTVPLLPTDWYREQIAERFRLLDSTGVVQYDGRMQTSARIAQRALALARPVAVAMTMTAAERARLANDWGPSGLAYVANGSDSATTTRIAQLIEDRIRQRDVRPAIDPVNQYYRRILECPKQLIEYARDTTSVQLDSACNYR